MIATAVALIPPEGAVEIATVGVPVYPLPSLLIKISLMYPVVALRLTFAVAVLPRPIRLSVVINPVS